MENRQEIKEGVKERLIDFIAEQISKEESFLTLKQEIIDEFLITKTVQEPEQKPLEEFLESKVERVSYGDFSFDKDAVNKRLDKLRDERSAIGWPTLGNADGKFKISNGNFSTFINAMDNAEKKNVNMSHTNGFQFPEPKNLSEAINKVKKGEIPTNLKGFLQDFNDSPDALEIVKNLQETSVYDNKLFTDYDLKYNYTESAKEMFRNNILTHLKKSEIAFYSEVFNNKPNYYKKFKATIGESFVLKISFVYNHATQSYFIDNFDASFSSQYIGAKDLGLLFAVEVLTLMYVLEETNTKKIKKSFNIKKPIRARAKTETIKSPAKKVKKVTAAKRPKK